jgi:hypothetical protein
MFCFPSCVLDFFFNFLHTLQLFHSELCCILNSNRDKETGEWTINSVASCTIFFIERLLYEMAFRSIHYATRMCKEDPIFAAV